MLDGILGVENWRKHVTYKNKHKIERNIKRWRWKAGWDQKQNEQKKCFENKNKKM